jgi:hypothetical protein
VSTLERTTRERALSGKSSPFVRQRGILFGYFIAILHSTVKRSLRRFAPSRLSIPQLRMKSKVLTSTFGTRRLFVRIVVIVVLTEQLLVSATRLSSVEKARPRTRTKLQKNRTKLQDNHNVFNEGLLETQLYEGSLHHSRSGECWNQTQLGGPPSLFSDLFGIRQCCRVLTILL